MPPPMLVLRGIEEWRSHDLRKLTDVEIDAKLSAFLDSLGEFVLSRKKKTFKCLWRIRKLEYLIKDESELWEPPEHKTRMGRCNAERHPILYTSEKLKTPFEELAIKPDEFVYLIKYNLKSPLNLHNLISSENELDQKGTRLFDTTSLISYRILREFVRSEFLKPVGIGTEYLHRISASMSRVWFDADDIDGWLYPSVYSVTDMNIALKPQIARKKLEVAAVRITKMVDKKSVLKSGRVLDATQPVFNLMKMVIQSDFKGELKKDGIFWYPCNELGGDF